MSVRATRIAPLVLALVPGVAGCRSFAGPHEAVAVETDGARSDGTPAGLQEDQRAALMAAEARASELAELRAGELDLSDRDIKVILVTAAVVILLVLIF